MTAGTGQVRRGRGRGSRSARSPPRRQGAPKTAPPARGAGPGGGWGGGAPTAPSAAPASRSPSRLQPPPEAPGRSREVWGEAQDELRRKLTCTSEGQVQPAWPKAAGRSKSKRRPVAWRRPLRAHRLPGSASTATNQAPAWGRAPMRSWRNEPWTDR